MTEGNTDEFSRMVSGLIPDNNQGVSWVSIDGSSYLRLMFECDGRRAACLQWVEKSEVEKFIHDGAVIESVAKITAENLSDARRYFIRDHAKGDVQ
jgi:hypothetical protein